MMMAQDLLSPSQRDRVWSRRQLLQDVKISHDGPQSCQLAD
jgi:hypothetical protein